MNGTIAGALPAMRTKNAKRLRALVIGSGCISRKVWDCNELGPGYRLLGNILAATNG